MNIKCVERELMHLIEERLPVLYDFPRDFSVSLLKYSENIIYKITFADLKTDPVVFRIHRPGYHNPEEVKSELIWMEEIANDTDVKVPVVYRGKNQEILQKLEDQKGRCWWCSVISFLKGTLLGELTGDELVTAVRQVGEITAKLHMQSMHRCQNPVLKRFSWDIDNFFSEKGVWGSWKNYPKLTREQYQILERCQTSMIDRLESYGRSKEHYGMIHGDLHFCNIIQMDGRNQIFDFDDCGYGFFMYDLGCTLVTCSRDLDKLTDAWVEGYEKQRILSKEDKEVLPMFLLLRRIVRLAWIASHPDSDTRNEMEPEYLEITIKMADKWMGKG